MKQTLLETAHGRVSVRDTGGGGPCVLLIHGNSSSNAVFRNQMTGELAQRYRLIAPDLPGHGASHDASDPPQNYTIPGYARTMIDVLGQLGIERPIVFGWSLGGHIGVDMLPRMPAIRALMITGAPPVSLMDGQAAFRPTPHMGLTGKEDFTAEEIEAYAAATCGEPVDPAVREAVARTDGRARRIMFAHFLSGQVPDQGKIVATTTIPIAVVNGADEPFVDTGFLAKKPIANLWEGKQHLVEGAGHAPFWEAPEKFNAIFARFLAAHER